MGRHRAIKSILWCSQMSDYRLFMTLDYLFLQYEASACRVVLSMIVHEAYVDPRTRLAEDVLNGEQPLGTI